MSTPQNPFTSFILPEKKSTAIDLKSILARYLYHWPLFIITLVIFLAAALFYLSRAKTVYEVKTTILIKDEKKTPEKESALQELDLLNSSKLVENEIEILKSRQLISQVVKDLGLAVTFEQTDNQLDLYKSAPVSIDYVPAGEPEKAPEIDIVIKDSKSFFLKSGDDLKELAFNTTYKNSFGSWKLAPTPNLAKFTGKAITITLLDPDELTLSYQKLIDVSLSNKLATAVVLTYEDPVPQRGKDILNQVVFNYNLQATAEKNRQTKSTLRFIDQRLDSLSGELTQAEKGIEGFKSSQGLTDISSDARISLDNMQANDKRLNEVNVQLTVIDGIERYVNSAQNAGNAPATLGISDPALTSLIERLSQLQLQKDRLLAIMPETNPDFEPLNRQIISTKAAIKENVRTIKSSLLNTRQQLQSFNSGFESSIKNIPTQERQYISIKRQQTSKENLYTYLLQKREEVAMSYASTLTDDRLVDQAYAGPAKKPKTPIILALALLLGMAFPAGLIYGRDLLNGTLVDVKDIQDVVDLPIIGELPLDDSKKPITINHTEINATTEQFRALRTKLYHLYGDTNRARVTLITSSVSGEGKSFVSSNLAVALAHIERKTVILELDMRKPKLAEIFGLSREHPGISDFLTANATLEQIIQPSGLTVGLDIIQCGSLMSNPSELLEKKQLAELIENLRNDYDDIIIDSSPVHLVPDAMILSRLSDLTLYIIRQGVTEKKELIFLKDINQQQLLGKIQLVFNGIESAKNGYGYHYKNEYYNTNTAKKRKSAIFSDFGKRW